MVGTVGFESGVGKGSAFWFEVPLSQEEHKQDLTAASEFKNKDFKGLSGKVLCVEDNPANLKLIEMIVSRVEGLTMVSANNAELGLEMVRAESPDIILMDINLPGMHGFDALKELKNMKHRGIPR